MKTPIKIVVIITVLLFVMSSCNSNDSKNELKAESVPSGPVLLSDSLNTAFCVYLTEDENGIPVISWVEIDTMEVKHFFFANWDTQENQFKSQVSIPIEQNASIHEEGMPKIVYKGDGTLMAVYEVSTPKEGSMWGVGDIRYIQSIDKGKSWSDVKSIFNDLGNDLSYSFGGICRLSDGEIGATCLGTSPDSTTIGRPILFSKTEGKKGFGENIQIEKEACQCCRTAISSDKNGNIIIAYRDLEPGNIRDIAISTSSDGGLTFTQPDIFSGDMWSINGCPHNGPSVKMYNNKTYIAWFTGGNEVGLHYAELDSTGKEIDKKFIDKDGEFIQLNLLPDGTRITSYDKSYEANDSVFSKIIVNKITDDGFFQKEITPTQIVASYPQVQPIDNKNIVVAWRQDNNSIYYQLVKTDEIQDVAKESELMNTTSIVKLNIQPNELISDIDLVCGMHLDERILGDTTLYKNDIYGFCSGHCKKMFVETPKRYVP